MKYNKIDELIVETKQIVLFCCFFYCYGMDGCEYKEELELNNV